MKAIREPAGSCKCDFAVRFVFIMNADFVTIDLAFLLPRVGACNMAQMFDLGRCRLDMWKRFLVLCKHTFMHGSE